MVPLWELQLASSLVPWSNWPSFLALCYEPKLVLARQHKYGVKVFDATHMPCMISPCEVAYVVWCLSRHM